MISKSDKAYFNAAKAVSKLSDHKHQLGCVLVHSHHIVSSGHNSATKYHSFQAQIDKKFFGCECKGPVHAEVDTLLPLIKQKYNFGGSTLYVYRQHKDGSLALAKPCPRCMALIKEQGIRKIKYTTEDGYAIEILA